MYIKLAKFFLSLKFARWRGREFVASNWSSYIAIRIVMLLYKDKREKDREMKRESRSVRGEMKCAFCLSLVGNNFCKLFLVV